MIVDKLRGRDMLSMVFVARKLNELIEELEKAKILGQNEVKEVLEQDLSKQRGSRELSEKINEVIDVLEEKKVFDKPEEPPGF